MWTSKVARKNTKRTEEYNTYSNITYILYTPPTAAARVVVSIKRYYILCRVNISSMFSQCIFVHGRRGADFYSFFFSSTIHFALGQTKLWGIRIHPYKLFVKMFCTPNITEYTLSPQISKTFSRVRSKAI